MMNEVLNRETEKYSSPLRDLELNEYEIQGHKFKQRKPCFDFRIRIEKKKFMDRYNNHQSRVLRDIKKYVSDKADEIGEVFTYLSKYEIENLFSADNKESMTKLENLYKDKPVLFSEFMQILTSTVSNVYSAMETFVMDRKNLADLFEIMLEGDISVINLNPDSEEEQAELDNMGLLILNDFFLNRNQYMN
jgi:hypothetical protein